MSDPIETIEAGPSFQIQLPSELDAAYRDAIRKATSDRWVDRLFGRDASLWSTDERIQSAIRERLGWLDAPAHFATQVAGLEGFSQGIVDAGFTTAIVAGMGGSSLAPEVLNKTFGTSEGWLALRVLDSTDPDAIRAIVDDLDPLATLFIVATKSGTTTEPLAFQADAWARLDSALRSHHAPRWESPGELMVAITDPGKSVAAIPHHDELREVFLNPADIGGRYSALTYVGLVPASLIGLEVSALLDSAAAMLERCRAGAGADNPGLSLGLAMGMLARNGRDKLTFVADPEIEAFGSWAEQLIAESTGKRGVGIVPVDLEPLGEPASYGPDRVFVRLTLEGSAGPKPTSAGTSADALLERLATDGHPIIRIALADPIDLGAEFVRWEIATAFAGAVLGIDPFDQPNVEEAKERTRDVLAGDAAGQQDQDAPGPSAAAVASGGGISVYGDMPLRLSSADGGVEGELRRHLARIKPTSYLALQAYFHATPERDAALARIRVLLRDRTRRATTSGYGPRFLHSTGQLHKGGPAIGWFLQLTADHPADRPIAGWPYSFGQLIDAQAAGDFSVLESRGLPILRVHLGSDPDAGLATLERVLAEVLPGA